MDGHRVAAMPWFDSSDVTTVPIEVVGSESGDVVCAVVNHIVGVVPLSLVSEMRRVDVPSLLLPPPPPMLAKLPSP